MSRERRTEDQRGIGLFEPGQVPEVARLSEAVAESAESAVWSQPMIRSGSYDSAERNAQDVLAHVLSLTACDHDDRAILEAIYEAPSSLLVLGGCDARREFSGREEVRVGRRKRLSEAARARAALYGSRRSSRVAQRSAGGRGVVAGERRRRLRRARQGRARSEASRFTASLAGQSAHCGRAHAPNSPRSAESGR